MVDTQFYQKRLSLAAAALKISIDENQSNQLLSYLSQIQHWNRSYNLTALKDPEQMLIQHLFDSMAVEPILKEILYKNTVKKPLIVDVGSGAGLPGIVLAILQPNWQIHCIDAVEKKTAFMRQMIGVLGLANLQVTHTRIEGLQPLQANIVISRAFASLVDFVSLAGCHLASNGQLLAMKGRHPETEIDELLKQTDWQVSAIHTLSVPELNAQRCLLNLCRQGNP